MANSVSRLFPGIGNGYAERFCIYVPVVVDPYLPLCAHAEIWISISMVSRKREKGKIET